MEASTAAAAREGLHRLSEFHRRQYGSRWSDLQAALVRPVSHVARLNRAGNIDRSRSRLLDAYPDAERVHELGDNVEAYRLPADPDATTPVPRDFAPPPRCEVTGLLDYYLMDPSSILAALALNVQPGDTVLDLCAAPGGKALILAEQLDGRGHIQANERASGRQSRLQRVMIDYLPERIRHKGVRVTGLDGTRARALGKEQYSKILVDAPCSSDRHVLMDLDELAVWSPTRIRANSKRQIQLLWAAAQALKPGGTVVYSTCALSDMENDDVVRTIIKRSGGTLSVDSTCPSWFAEPTECGFIALPDRSGFGPLYFARLVKSPGNSFRFDSSDSSDSDDSDQAEAKEDVADD
ncbi:uncharacterized protein MONBRDRAFT_28431 [Monosiga brevicollis MX1]|uniref:NOL1/NOP2/Sun domain family member 4 n=1 Tax=Monosiga brevicollis TaxID=81824 RepID=A9V855_MONBE|nr:uncharacterized protein MONBRDRAFT_28431 [Monosiga brevicollis MX1]EDQ86213.1 predicted protein [Monosiga brevicollis MX1]|eukprot:XP_001748883.1 hypothetical protein [Monosiga brevicollis MX1]